jgi:hypothetical protein
MFEDINFNSKEYIYNPYPGDQGQIIEEQLYDEDVFQVNYHTDNTRYTIDVGWYPAFSPEGSFRIVIVKNCDWENYLYDKRTKDYGQLHKYMEECVGIVMKLLKSNEQSGEKQK